MHHEYRLRGSSGRGRTKRLRQGGVGRGGLPHGRNGRDHHRVTAVVGQRTRQRGVELLRRGGRGQVHRGQRPQPLRQTGVVGEQPERLGVAEDRHPRTGRERLACQQKPRVDQLRDRVHPDDPGLPQQRRHRRVRQPRGAHGVPLGCGAAVPCALDDDEWLRRRRAPREARELPRVPDGFEVHERDVGVRIFEPVLQDVVAGHVRAVARGDEGRHAGHARDPAATPVQPGQQGDPDGSGLREEPDPSGTRHLRRERGVEPHLRGGVDDSEGVRSDDAHPVRTRLAHELALPLPAFGAAFGVPGGHHDEPLHPVLTAFGDGIGHALGRDRDDGEVDGLGDVTDGAVGRDSGELLLLKCSVHRVQAPGEACVAEVVQDAAAHSPGCAAGADDGDRAGREEPGHGAPLGPLLPRALHGERAVGGLQVELQAYDAVLEAALLLVPGVREHLDHLAVGGQHLGGEAADVALAGDGRDVLQQGRRDAAALVGVLHEEGDLGLVRRARRRAGRRR